MNVYAIPVQELTSQAAIFGIAAEIIQTNMLNEQDVNYRMGCCRAFSHITEAVERAYHHDRISLSRRSSLCYMVREAKSNFASLYQQDGSRHTKDSVYWMGTRNNTGQKRRIAALLTAAKVFRKD